VFVGALAGGLVLAITLVGAARMPSGHDSRDVAGAPPAALQTASLAKVAIVREAAAESARVESQHTVPEASGEGRRIVFSEGQQRVWLVGVDERVERTYLVSGSRFDNLDPGTYDVESKARHATAFDNSGTMEYFVRFATGWRAPIGFHTIPLYNDGTPEQTREQLGTPLSAGCVRQWEADAKALWDFADIGTTVVVTA